MTGIGRGLLGRLYVLLADGTTKLAGSMERWSQAFGERVQHVRWTFLPGYNNSPPRVVSTIFMGIDSNYTDKGPPILFETMVFRATPAGRIVAPELAQKRYATSKQAEEGHMAAVHAAGVRAHYLEVLTHQPAVYQREVFAGSRREAEQQLRTEAWPFGFAGVREFAPRRTRRGLRWEPYRVLADMPDVGSWRRGG